jgi:hypothetical protein
MIVCNWNCNKLKKQNLEKLRRIIKIMHRIEELWSIENWQIKKSFVKIIYNYTYFPIIAFIFSNE